MNDGNEFLSSFKNIYPTELELKYSIIVYKLFGKRDKFPFFIVWMPYLSSNIPSTIFRGSIFSGLLRIARYTLRINDFILRASDLFSRMIVKGGNRAALTKQLKKAFHRYPTGINTSIMKST